MRPHGQTKLSFFPLPIAEVTRLQKNWQDNSAFTSLPAVGQDEARRIGEDGDLMDRYIIAGREGVVKATLATKFLPKYANCQNFIKADLIAQGMSPFAAEPALFEPGDLY